MSSALLCLKELTLCRQPLRGGAFRFVMGLPPVIQLSNDGIFPKPSSDKGDPPMTSWKPLCGCYWCLSPTMISFGTWAWPKVTPPSAAPRSILWDALGGSIGWVRHGIELWTTRNWGFNPQLMSTFLSTFLWVFYGFLTVGIFVDFLVDVTWDLMWN